MLPEQPADELLDSTRIADELGFYGCYSADEIYHKDGWMLLAAGARQTERIRLGPCVAPTHAPQQIRLFGEHVLPQLS